ncbi:hypothetical protein MTO96_050476 [Rhipicephalus appendiculatus]
MDKGTSDADIQNRTLVLGLWLEHAPRIFIFLFFCSRDEDTGARIAASLGATKTPAACEVHSQGCMTLALAVCEIFCSSKDYLDGHPAYRYNPGHVPNSHQLSRCAPLR